MQDRRWLLRPTAAVVNKLLRSPRRATSSSVLLVTCSVVDLVVLPHASSSFQVPWPLSPAPPYWACPVELFCSSGFWAGGVGDAQDARRTRGAKVFPRSSHLSVFSLDIIPIYLSMCFQYTSAFCMLSPSFVGWAAVSAQFVL